MMHPPPWLVRAVADQTLEHAKPRLATSSVAPFARLRRRQRTRPATLSLDDVGEGFVDRRERLGVELDA
jgi:hypothetical protein